MSVGAGLHDHSHNPWPPPSSAVASLIPYHPGNLKPNLGPMYHQNYNPTGSVLLSTIVAAIPILALLYFIALHPHRDKEGARHLAIAAPQAAFFGVLGACLVSCLPFGMPLASAFSAFALGTLSGFLGIIWIVLAAMFLYTMTVITGKFEIVKESITHISFDRRLQV